jgi:hypothetical protein
VSIEASSFVLGLSMGRGNGIRKLILLGYANHADKRGRGAYPSTRTIADYAECDVRTVQRHVSWLIANGFLNEGDQRMVVTSIRGTGPSSTTSRRAPNRSSNGRPTASRPPEPEFGQHKQADVVGKYRPRSARVTICHPCPRTHRRRPAGVTICHPWKPRPGVTVVAVQG